MDIVADNGTTYKIAIAPTLKIANLPIKEGDRVRVDGFTPPMFPEGVIKAVDIYDITQQKDYPISGRNNGYGRCGGYGKGYHGGYHNRGYYHKEY